MHNIPEDKLPQEFKDESRLDSLFSPFRSRSTNPRDWTSKVSSWKQLIALYCETNRNYSFTLSSLNKLFIRNGRPPSCLIVVVDELIKSGEIQKLDDFLKQRPQTWSGWAADLLVKKPLSWSYNTVKKTLFSDSVSHECVFVHLTVLCQEVENFLLFYPDSYKNKVVDFPNFLKISERSQSEIDNVKLLLHYLAQKQIAAIYELKDGTSLIKIARDSKVTPISEVEVGVYVLEKNEDLFTKHIEQLDDEIANIVRIVKGHLIKGHRQLAKAWLRKKHEVEKRLERKINALQNIQSLLEKIRDVHTDAEVWKSYKHALAAFDKTFKETGMNEDAVEETMIKIGEVTFYYITYIQSADGPGKYLLWLVSLQAFSLGGKNNVKQMCYYSTHLSNHH